MKGLAKTAKETQQEEVVYIVQEDCRLMYNHQMLELRKGQEVDHQLGSYLEETGGPVERK